MTSQSLFQKTFILKRPGIAIVADIIKIVSMFIKAILKDSGKVRRIRNYVSKWNLYLYFLMPVNNTDASRTQEVCHVIHIVFRSSLGV